MVVLFFFQMRCPESMSETKAGINASVVVFGSDGGEDRKGGLAFLHAYLSSSPYIYGSPDTYGAIIGITPMLARERFFEPERRHFHLPGATM